MAKPLKVRILKSTLNDGAVTYTAQYRMMGLWFSFAGDDYFCLGFKNSSGEMYYMTDDEYELIVT